MRLSDKSGIVSLFFTSGLALAATAISYLYYSKYLQVDEFGLYSLALAVAVIANIVLDGGLKTTLIKRPEALSPAVSQALASGVLLVSVLAGIALVFGWLVVKERVDFQTAGDVRFVLLFSYAYVITYPLTIMPTVYLERNLQYRTIGWIESTGIIIERAFPAFLLAAGGGMESFVIAAYAGRSFRVLALIFATREQSFVLRNPRQAGILSLLAEGLWFQCALAASALRDNLHVLLIGPMFGKEWLGYYAWVIQVGTISSQLFVQIASRVSVPLLAGKSDFQSRWNSCLLYMRTLSLIAIPVLASVWMILPSVDNWLFDGKWAAALALVPPLFFRMSVGLATSPLGVLLLVDKGAMQYWKANIGWTLCEVAGAVALIYIFGSAGLAWSSAAMVLAGVYFLVKTLNGHTSAYLLEILRAVYLRPGVLVTLVVVAVTAATNVSPLGRDEMGWGIVASCAMLLFLAYASELLWMKFRSRYDESN